MKELIVIYEPKQGAIVEAYARGRQAEIIALSYEAEQEMRRRGLAVLPLSRYCQSWGALPATASEGLWREWYRIPEMSFFSYEGLMLGEALELPLYIYFLSIRCYLEIFKQIFIQHPDVTKLVVPRSTVHLQGAEGPIAYFLHQIVERAGAWYAARRNIGFETVGEFRAVAPIAFPPASMPHRIALALYNAVVGLLPRKTLRLYVSDHWRNLQAVVAQLPDAELLFADRKELRAIPWRELIRHRVQFTHPLDVMTPQTRISAGAAARGWVRAWNEAKSAVRALPGFSHEGASWWGLAEPALDFLIGTWGERLAADVLSVKKILKEEKINRVVLRASVSVQHHFYIMGELAPRLGIPSFELQHGMGVGILGAEVPFGFMHAQYLLSYGPLFARALEKQGYGSKQVIGTGSPRFDRYIQERGALTEKERMDRRAALELAPDKPIIFVVMPAPSELPLGSADLSGYEFEDYVRSLGAVAKALPKVQFLLKFRSSAQLQQQESLIRNLLPSERIALETGDAFSFALICDVAYACFSTTALECLMARRPTLLFPLKSGDVRFYEAHKEGTVAVPLAREGRLPTEELIDATRLLLEDPVHYMQAVAKGERYLAEYITFDGTAAKRTADAIRATYATQR